MQKEEWIKMVRASKESITRERGGGGWGERQRMCENHKNQRYQKAKLGVMAKWGGGGEGQNKNGVPKHLSSLN